MNCQPILCLANEARSATLLKIAHMSKKVGKREALTARKSAASLLTGNLIWCRRSGLFEAADFCRIDERNGSYALVAIGYSKWTDMLTKKAINLIEDREIP
jgi:hypothetical protein